VSLPKIHIELDSEHICCGKNPHAVVAVNPVDLSTEIRKHGRENICKNCMKVHDKNKRKTESTWRKYKGVLPRGLPSHRNRCWEFFAPKPPHRSDPESHLHTGACAACADRWNKEQEKIEAKAKKKKYVPEWYRFGSLHKPKKWTKAAQVELIEFQGHGFNVGKLRFKFIRSTRPKFSGPVSVLMEYTAQAPYINAECHDGDSMEENLRMAVALLSKILRKSKEPAISAEEAEVMQHVIGSKGPTYKDDAEKLAHLKHTLESQIRVQERDVAGLSAQLQTFKTSVIEMDLVRRERKRVENLICWLRVLLDICDQGDT
jgi:hypothetical protein